MLAVQLLWQLSLQPALAERPALAIEDAATGAADAVYRAGQCLFLASGESVSSLGSLTTAGEQQVDRRLELIFSSRDSRMMDAVTGARLVWVAPTRAAMATALIVLTRAFVHHPDRRAAEQGEEALGENIDLPRIELRPELSGSPRIRMESLGESSDLIGYLQDIAHRYSHGKYLTNGEAWVAEKMLLQMKNAYLELLSKTRKPISSEDALAVSSLDLYEGVHRVKTAIASLTATSTVVLIGSPTFATYLFMPHLPAAAASPYALSLSSMQSMRREVLAVAPASGMLSEWMTSSKRDGKTAQRAYFTSVLDFAPSEKLLPSFTSPTPVPYDEMGFGAEEVEVANVFPAGTSWWVGLMQKSQKRRRWFGYTDPLTRLIYISWQVDSASPAARGKSRGGYVTWMTPFGETVRGCENLHDVQVTLLPGTPLSSSSVQMTGVRGSWILDGGEDANDDFVQTIKKAQKR